MGSKWFNPKVRLPHPNDLHRPFSLLVTWLLAAFAVYLMVLFSSLVVQEYRIAQDVARKEVEVAQATQQQRDLQDRLAYVRSDAAMEIIARERLDMAQPGDTVLQLNIVQPTPTPPATTGPAAAAAPAQDPAAPPGTQGVPAKPANWRRWLDILFNS
ncbi:MAG TPA: septum formation initiator family protein [Herpetosiphonaceae bacterium]|nr:septum formation initiator family protein [Herpetosiphonaceae bacterium]